MARSPQELTEGSTRRHRRVAAITVAVVGLLGVSALVAVPAIASGDGGSRDRVVVCESDVETRGDISMSAAVATRVPAGDTTPTPAGCREG